jgi:hypothetical protein
MWVYIARSSAIDYATLFYKGNRKSSSGRTPSAWIMPEGNKFIIQVSARDDPQITAENDLPFTMFEWQLLTFVISNSTIDVNITVDVAQFEREAGGDRDSSDSSERSEAAEARRSNYSIHVYRNDKLDVK